MNNPAQQISKNLAGAPCPFVTHYVTSAGGRLAFCHLLRDNMSGKEAP